jgi:hypothetical protein
MTHASLVEIGYRWVLSRCSFAFKELVTLNMTGEVPDVIGFRNDGTFLLEAKTSREDFLCDKKKPFRINPETGMGDWRFYIAPSGLIKESELPPLWGLVEVNEKGNARCTCNPYTDRPKSNILSMWVRNPKNTQAEMDMMISALRRLHIQGVIPLIYSSIKTRK